MNVLEFWGRIIWGIFMGMISLAMFSEKKPVAGIAALITALFIVFTPVLMRRRYERPHSLSSLKQEFDIYMLLTWTRGLVGLLMGICGVAVLSTPDGKEYNMMASAPVFLLLGWFLLSPLNNKVFTYPKPDRAKDGRWRWSVKAGTKFFARGTGLFLAIMGGALLAIKEVKLAEALFVLVCGIALIFVQQIKQLITGAPQIADGSASPEIGQASATAPGMQPGQPAVTPAYPPVDAVAMELASLAEQYKKLQRLPAASKGTAYGAFLSRLFNDQGLLISGAFTVKDTAISGSFELEGQIYILAAQWQAEKSNEDALLVFNAKVESKSTWARGIFISEAGFTKDGLTLFSQGKRTSIIGMDGKDLQLVLEGRLSLIDAIKRKARRAVETNYFFVPLRELI